MRGPVVKSTARIVSVANAGVNSFPWIFLKNCSDGDVAGRPKPALLSATQAFTMLAGPARCGDFSGGKGAGRHGRRGKRRVKRAWADLRACLDYAGPGAYSL